MKSRRIYIDTSVAGGYFDPEFADPTRRLFQLLEAGAATFVISDILETELANAPRPVRELLRQFPATSFEPVFLTEEAIALAEAYITAKVVGAASVADCRHIALASVQQVDVLASWNFKHIVNLDRIRGYNSVNLRLGYALVEIRSPKDLISYENES